MIPNIKNGFFSNMQQHLSDCLASRGFSGEGARQIANGQQPENLIDRILAGPESWFSSNDYSPDNLAGPDQGCDEGYGPDGLYAGVHNLLKEGGFPPGIDAAYSHEANVSGGIDGSFLDDAGQAVSGGEDSGNLW